jgi:predicted component of type VI protein secretion system
VDDFPFVFDTITPKSEAFLSVSVDEPWVESENLGANSLMTDNFPSHEELVQTQSDRHPANFESRLQGNQSPLFDSYIAPNVIASPASSTNNAIPDNFSFDDFFSANEHEMPQQVISKPTVNNDFEDFFSATISDIGTDNATPISEIPIEHNHEAIEPVELFASKNTLTDEPPLFSSPTELNGETLIELNQTSNAFNLFADNDAPNISELLIENNHTIGVVEWTDERSPAFDIEPAISVKVDTPTTSNIHPEEIKTAPRPVIENTKPAPADSVLFNAFLQGAKVDGNKIQPEQQAETLNRIGQMFRKLIDGTVAVLRSRAEFKSLCRVNMTVIKASDNNPLKFTVSTDDVLRQLLENKADGFLTSTVAIEEAFNDIMNHQLAMQAGIQASLTDLLHGFDPKVIEKQFEQGLVLQKKAKCWESYEKTYHHTVEDAVENFFGEAFVDAYEKQMRLLTKSRKK